MSSRRRNVVASLACLRPRQRWERVDSCPKDAPGAVHTDTHHRVRADRIDTNGKLTLRVNGRLHHIAMGRTLARTPVLMLIHDLDVHIIDAATGELLRDLTIDPNRYYQPTGKDRYARWRRAAQKPEKTDP